MPPCAQTGLNPILQWKVSLNCFDGVDVPFVLDGDLSDAVLPGVIWGECGRFWICTVSCDKSLKCLISLSSFKNPIAWSSSSCVNIFLLG